MWSSSRPREALALAAWSSVHGLSVVLLDGLLQEEVAALGSGMELADVGGRVAPRTPRAG